MSTAKCFIQIKISKTYMSQADEKKICLARFFEGQDMRNGQLETNRKN